MRALFSAKIFPRSFRRDGSSRNASRTCFALGLVLIVFRGLLVFILVSKIVVGITLDLRHFAIFLPIMCQFVLVVRANAGLITLLWPGVEVMSAATSGAWRFVKGANVSFGFHFVKEGLLSDFVNKLVVLFVVVFSNVTSGKPHRPAPVFGCV